MQVNNTYFNNKNIKLIDHKLYVKKNEYKGEGKM